LLKKRQDKEPSPFSTRSNQQQQQQYQQQQQEPTAAANAAAASRWNSTDSLAASEVSTDKQVLRQMLHDRRGVSNSNSNNDRSAPAVAAYLEPDPSLRPLSSQTPTRTPNPVSRSDYSGKKGASDSSTGDPNRTFLRNMLQKAHSRETSASGSGSDPSGQQQQQQIDQKELLRRVLAKTRAKKTKTVAKAARMSPKRSLQQEPSPVRSASNKSSKRSPAPGSRAAKVQSHSVTLTLRDRMRRVKQQAAPAVAATPTVAVEEMPDLPAPRELSWRKQQPQQPSLFVPHSVPQPKRSNETTKILGIASSEGPIQQVARATVKSVPVAVATLEEEMPDGYAEFLETLQTEVSGQHSQVRIFVLMPARNRLVKLYHCIASF
jgi:hypothetical protein